MLLCQDDLGDFGDVGIGDLAVAVDVGVILLELRRSLALRLIDHLHDVGSVHLVVAVGVALEADLKRGRAADGIVAAVLISNGNRSRTHIRIVAVAHGVLLGRDHRLAVLHGHRRSLCRAVVEVIGLLQRDGRSADSLCRDGERCGAADGIVAVGLVCDGHGGRGAMETGTGAPLEKESLVYAPSEGPESPKNGQSKMHTRTGTQCSQLFHF